MDTFLQRLNELAQDLAANHQAISLQTAHDLVDQVATSVGLAPLPARAAKTFARELQTLILENWDRADDQTARVP